MRGGLCTQTRILPRLTVPGTGSRVKLPSPIALVLAVSLAGCAKVPVLPGPTRFVTGAGPTRAPTAPTAAPAGKGAAEPDRTALVKAAEHYLTGSLGGYRDDCSGYVCAVLNRVGIEVEGSTATLWALAEAQGSTHTRKVPKPGDLAFFDQTYDRNHNGKLDDDLTHIAVVLTVEPDGTVVMGHGGTSEGRTTLRMNLLHPDVRSDEAGRVLNDLLRREKSSDPKGTRYLASELWRGFATLE
jgi:hypothetical protein